MGLRARERLWLVGPLAVAAAVWWWWPRTAKQPESEPPRRRPHAAAQTTPPRDPPLLPTGAPTTATADPSDGLPASAPPSPPSPPSSRAAPAPSTPFDASLRHTADPCTALAPPTIPDDYETLVDDDITIAWSTDTIDPGPYDVPLRPLELAHLVAGLLDEAAGLTGTDRRRGLTVIVHASQDQMLARLHAPAWVGGVYDGGAVHVPTDPTRDLRVDLVALRHEVMHAQLHAAVGCVPFWFNEGLAQYFGGTPTITGWIAMLRAADDFAPAALRDPALEDLQAKDVGRLYARSLAMIVYLVDRAGEAELRVAAHTARTAGSEQGALELWERLHPGTDGSAVLEALARKLFGMSPGSELDAILATGALCCHGLRVIADVRCRGAAPRPGTSIWRDDSRSPRAACRNRW